MRENILISIFDVSLMSMVFWGICITSFNAYQYQDNLKDVVQKNKKGNNQIGNQLALQVDERLNNMQKNNNRDHAHSNVEIINSLSHLNGAHHKISAITLSIPNPKDERN